MSVRRVERTKQITEFRWEQARLVGRSRYRMVLWNPTLQWWRTGWVYEDFLRRGRCVWQPCDGPCQGILHGHIKVIQGCTR